MHQYTQWQPTDQFDPYNPNQLVAEPNDTWPGQGGYTSFYWNKQPTTVKQLEGLRGAGTAFDITTYSPGVQMLIVGLVAGAVGYFGMRTFGSSLGFKGK